MYDSDTVHERGNAMVWDGSFESWIGGILLVADFLGVVFMAVLFLWYYPRGIVRGIGGVGVMFGIMGGAIPSLILASVSVYTLALPLEDFSSRYALKITKAMCLLGIVCSVAIHWFLGR